MRIIFIYNYYMELTNDNIITAINMYLNNKKKATIIYGNIEEWNTENITDMQKLFMNKRKFNNDISKWNVSNVTNMNYMFFNAKQFNCNLNKWNVSKVKTMYFMFYNAITFNQNISNWDTGNVIIMNGMFFNAISFNQNIGEWNVSNNINLTTNMFYNATELQKKFKTLNTLSFFSDKFITMDCNKRKKIFNKLFNWERRKNFVIFLHNYNYSILRNFIT